MRRSPKLSALAFVALLGTEPLLPAKTWVVDQLNRPGTDFTDLVTAVSTAAAGDVLYVRAAKYRKAPTISKSLSILCEKGATLDTIRGFRGPVVQLRVKGLPVGSHVSIQGLTLDSGSRNFELQTALVIEDNLGTVHLQGVRVVDGDPNRDPGSYGIHVRSSAVTLKDVRVDSTLRVEGSNILLESCALRGKLMPSTPWLRAEPALDLDSSIAKLIATSCEAQRNTYYNAGPAVRGSGSGFEVHRGCRFVSMGTVHWLESDPVRQSVLHVDPQLGFTAQHTKDFLLVVQRPLVSLLSKDAILGGALRLQLDGRANDAAALFLGAPSQPRYLAPIGELWLELGSAFVLGSAVLPSSGSASWQVPVPNDLRLAGVLLGFQALAGPVHKLELSNASFEVVHPAP